jgi:hypothetical protein
MRSFGEAQGIIHYSFNFGADSKSEELCRPEEIQSSCCRFTVYCSIAMRILTIPFVLTVCIAAGEAASFRRESLSLGRQDLSAASHQHVRKATTEEEDRLVVARGGDQVKGGDATMTAMVFNLVNNVAGTYVPRLISHFLSRKARHISLLCMRLFGRQVLAFYLYRRDRQRGPDGFPRLPFRWC